MTVEILVVAGLVALGLLLAFIMKPKADAPTVPSYRAPAQFDPADIDLSVGKNLVAFIATDCDSCGAVLEMLAARSEPSSVYEASQNKQLFEKYKIDGVPTVLVVDEAGIVTASLFGPTTNADVSAALAS